MAGESPRSAKNLRKVGGLIRDARKNRKLSLQELSRTFDLSLSYMSKIERGELIAGRDTYERIFDLLDLNKEELLPLIGLVPSEFEKDVVKYYQEVQGFLRRKKANEEKKK